MQDQILFFGGVNYQKIMYTRDILSHPGGPLPHKYVVPVFNPTSHHSINDYTHLTTNMPFVHEYNLDRLDIVGLMESVFVYEKFELMDFKHIIISRFLYGGLYGRTP